MSMHTLTVNRVGGGEGGVSEETVVLHWWGVEMNFGFSTELIN